MPRVHKSRSACDFIVLKVPFMNISHSQPLPACCLPGWEAEVKSEWHNDKKKRKKRGRERWLFVKKWNRAIVPSCKWMWQLGTQETLAQSAHWRPAGPPVCHKELRPEDFIADTGSRRGSCGKHRRATYAPQTVRQSGGKMNPSVTRLMAAL